MSGSRVWVEEQLQRLPDSTITSISGSISGFAATFAKQPLQRIKWIRQIDSGRCVPYSELVSSTIRRDGLLGLFRGSTAGIIRNVPHSMLVYSIYPKCEHFVLAKQQQVGGSLLGLPCPQSLARLLGCEAAHTDLSSGGKVAFSTRFWAGYATLMCATMVTHPLDTIRVRISVTSSNEGLAAVLRGVQQTGGVRALYHGYGATLLGAGPRGAVGFGVFETLKEFTESSGVLQGQPLSFRKLLFGYIAGLCAETLIYPIDTVRRRQQALGDASPLSQRGALSAIVLLFRHEGISGAFKGISLNLFKNPIATAVSFTINDLVKDLLGYRGKERKEGGSF
ncbi:hypothetical protein AB1Y20_023317 [Prymnesium parvum]|uniref:ADP,ATP carrier protein n=1 Tax=Prymnesium parvum TaxID=97485 RepID=A0AB34JCU0_PRYPA|mmetsp:Transcript_21319/g.53129  ORF Transcript_21319/g.53129 Transcript_21319/m.53129 type:complete len:337 (+) Transcript_21319:59-1069(+)